MRGMRYQPQGGARLNAGNPLTRGLIAVFVGSQAFDPVSGKPFVNAAPANRVPGTMGIALDARVGQAKAAIAGPSISNGSLFVVVNTMDPTTEQIIAEIGPDGSFSAGVRGLRFVNGQFSAYVRNFYDLLTPGTFSINAPIPVGVTYAGSATSIYVNGQLSAAGTTADTTSAAAIFNVGGITGQTAYNLRGMVPVAYAWSRVLSAQEMAALASNPWQLFAAPHEDEVVAVNATLVPGVASTTITGYAPSVVRGVTTDVAPGAGGVTLIGYAPSVTQGLTKTISPAPASMTVTGYAPTVSQTAARSTNPAPAALTITGYAPTVSRGASQTIPAGAAVPSTLQLRGYAPTITQANNITPHYADVTIMRFSRLQAVANLGPDRLQQTTGFP